MRHKREAMVGQPKQACYQNSDAGFTLFTDGEPTGWVDGDEFIRVTTDWNSRTWKVNYQFWVRSVTGTAINARMNASTWCDVRSANGNCSTNREYDEIVLDPTVSNRHLTTTTEFIGIPAAGDAVDVQALHTLTITGRALYSETVQSEIVRCDRAPRMRGTEGCVIRAVTPVWDLRDTPNIDAYRKHVSLAQQSGLPGYVNNSGSGNNPLQRITDLNGINTRRKISCGGVTGPRPSGRSCDEYPMASTMQGGGNGAGVGIAQTFPQSFCGIRDLGIYELTDPPGGRGAGYSVCLIPASQNSRAGSLQTWFYTKTRVLNGDYFLVRAE